MKRPLLIEEAKYAAWYRVYVDDVNADPISVVLFIVSTNPDGYELEAAALMPYTSPLETAVLLPAMYELRIVSDGPIEQLVSSNPLIVIDPEFDVRWMRVFVMLSGALPKETELIRMPLRKLQFAKETPGVVPEKEWPYNVNICDVTLTFDSDRVDEVKKYTVPPVMVLPSESRPGKLTPPMLSAALVNVT
jgi:hypothetical protein